MKLPADIVLHTGVAMSHILLYLDSGAVNLKENYKLHAVVSEACLKQWSQQPQPSWRNRLDNINHCLRAFGVDGRSTRCLEDAQSRQHSGQAMLRSSMQIFMMLGDGLVGIIDIPQSRSRLQWLGKRVLSEESFAQEMSFAAWHGGSAPNGVRLWRNKGRELQDLVTQVSATSGTGANVLLLMLDPSGRPLRAKWT